MLQPVVAHDCGYPLSRYTCRATRVAADFLDFRAFCRCSIGVALHPLKILVSHLPPPGPGGVAPKFGSEKVSRYTGVSQLQLRVSHYTVQLRHWKYCDRWENQEKVRVNEVARVGPNVTQQCANWVHCTRRGSERERVPKQNLRRGVTLSQSQAASEKAGVCMDAWLLGQSGHAAFSTAIFGKQGASSLPGTYKFTEVVTGPHPWFSRHSKKPHRLNVVNVITWFCDGQRATLLFSGVAFSRNSSTGPFKLKNHRSLLFLVCQLTQQGLFRTTGLTASTIWTENGLEKAPEWSFCLAEGEKTEKDDLRALLGPVSGDPLDKAPGHLNPSPLIPREDGMRCNWWSGYLSLSGPLRLRVQSW